MVVAKMKSDPEVCVCLRLFLNRCTVNKHQ